MKYLYAFIGLVVLGGIGVGSYYLGQSSGRVSDTNKPADTESSGSPSIINGMDLPDMSGINIFGNNVVTPTPVVSNPTPTPTPKVATKTYTNQKYGYAFDYPADYHLDLTFANNAYSERGGSGVMVGGGVDVSSEPFPQADPGEPSLGFQCYQDPTSAPCTYKNKPADYVGFQMWVIKASSSASIAQAITNATDFINYDLDVLTSKDYTTQSGLVGLARLYKAIYYNQLGAERGDLTTPQDE